MVGPKYHGVRHVSRRIVLGLVALFVVALVAACGGAYGKAVERGDKYAAARQWDKAAAEYQRAIELEPEEPEARIKLDRVRERQAGEHLEKSRALEARGEIERALAAVQKAAALQPDHTPTQRELTRLSKVVLKRAQKLVDDDKLLEALELTGLVLEGAPRHRRARALDKRIRARLAAQAYERAEEYAARELLGNALVELAVSLTYRPKFPEAKLEFGRIKLALEKELTFAVELSPFSGRGKNASVSRALTPTIVRQSMDERLLLRVAATGQARRARAGVALSGELSGYDFRRGQRSEQRSCDYVCGVESRSNPQRGRVERELGTTEKSLSQAERYVSQGEKKVLELERKLADAQVKVDRAQVDLDKARERYDRCMERAKPEASNPCSSERNRVESEQRDLERTRRGLDWPQRDLDNARGKLERERDMRNRKRDDVARARQRLRDTPSTIEVERRCAFNYSVSIHDVESRVTMSLTMERLEDRAAIIRNEPFQYSVQSRDSEFRAISGRCAEVSRGDPLQLPSEADLRNELLKKVIRDVRAKIVASYDSYRARYLTVARKHESAGNTSEAVEAYVRYVLTGPHDVQGSGKIDKFLRKARGIGKLDSLWSL